MLAWVVVCVCVCACMSTYTLFKMRQGYGVEKGPYLITSSNPNWILYYRSSQVWTTHFPLSLFTFSFFHSSLLSPLPSFSTPFILCCFLSAWTSHRFFFVVVSSRSWYCGHCSLLSLSLKASGRFWSWLGGVSHGHPPAWFTPAVCIMKHVALTHIPPHPFQIRDDAESWFKCVCPWSFGITAGDTSVAISGDDKHETLTHGSFPLALIYLAWQSETALISF